METGGRHSFAKEEIYPRTLKTPIQNKSHTILPGMPFSISIYYLHHDETVFPSSYKFHPSRWLADPVTGRPPVGPDDEKLLTRYLIRLPAAQGSA